MHNPMPAANPDLSQPEKTVISVRTDLRAGLDKKDCHIKADGFCVTMCCPTPEGEKCTTSCPSLLGF